MQVTGPKQELHTWYTAPWISILPEGLDTDSTIPETKLDGSRGGGGVLWKRALPEGVCTLVPAQLSSDTVGNGGDKLSSKT